MKRPRDTQREKLYRSEDAVRSEFGGREFESIDEIEKYLLNLVKQQWFIRTFQAPAVRCFCISDGRGTRRAFHYGTVAGRAHLSFPKWARYELVVLHELAHAVTPRDVPGHGREFCANFLRLVENRLGKDAERALRESMRRNGVKFRPKRVLSPERLEELRRRGCELAAKRRAK